LGVTDRDGGGFYYQAREGGFSMRICLLMGPALFTPWKVLVCLACVGHSKKKVLFEIHKPP
jgi:hypothetical protein